MKDSLIQQLRKVKVSDAISVVTAIVGVAIALQANRLIDAQNKLISVQSQLADAQYKKLTYDLLPILTITPNERNKLVTIQNEGSDAFNITVEHKTLLDVYCGTDSSQGYVFFPVRDSRGPFKDLLKKGQSFTFSPRQANPRQFAKWEKFIRAYESDGWGLELESADTEIKVSYLDIAGRSHTKFYSIINFGDELNLFESSASEWSTFTRDYEQVYKGSGKEVAEIRFSNKPSSRFFPTWLKDCKAV